MGFGADPDQDPAKTLLYASLTGKMREIMKLGMILLGT